MKVLFAAGGTAGHVNPALAIAKGVCSKWQGAEIYFAGRKSGMEYQLLKKAGYEFNHIEVHGFQRSFSPNNVARNISAMWHLAHSPFAARKILKKIKPDIVIGTGGYVSGPVLREAAICGYKTAIHEQNAFPGVTNKILAKKADIIFAPNENALKRLGQPEKTVISGNPVQAELFSQNRQNAKEKIGANERLVLLSYGGSLGAMRVNEVIAGLAKWHLKNENFLHIHATGSIENKDFSRLMKEKGIDNKPNFVVREYIDDMAAMLAAADLVICRAGALTLAELCAVGRASILIPSPNVAENHQYYNALELQNVGAARVLEEKDLTSEKLISLVKELTSMPDMLAEMGENAKKLAKPEAIDIILAGLEGLLETCE